MAVPHRSDCGDEVFDVNGSVRSATNITDLSAFGEIASEKSAGATALVGDSEGFARLIAVSVATTTKEQPMFTILPSGNFYAGAKDGKQVPAAWRFRIDIGLRAGDAV